jgi:alpha-L-glutamate ligase-like protein
MAVSKSILGMNARNFLYIRPYNLPSTKRIADDKLMTKQVLLEHHIPTPELHKTFYTRSDVRNFDWQLPEHGFVIKPARGYGGNGILAFKQWRNNTGITMNGEIYTINQLESHIFNILDGAFSLQYLPDKAFIEGLVTQHPFFKKIAPMGMTDIRVIVFKRVPIMAMIRIPTQRSAGKANLHLGALAAGIDISTGITTNATDDTQLIYHLPSTKKKTAGIKLPDWDQILLLATKAQSVIGLGFAGVDLVIDAKKGPLVLEINARPGLKIQNANLASLRTRLERVEGMDIKTPERGVALAKSLFAESFSEKVITAPQVLPFIYPITIKHNNTIKTFHAKLDTGAYRSSLDKKLARDLGIKSDPKKIYIQSASGTAYRPTAKISFTIAGKKISNTTVSLVNRSHLQYPMIIGRIDLKGFLIKPEREQEEDNEQT